MMAMMLYNLLFMDLYCFGMIYRIYTCAKSTYEVSPKGSICRPQDGVYIGSQGYVPRIVQARPLIAALPIIS